MKTNNTDASPSSVKGSSKQTPEMSPKSQFQAVTEKLNSVRSLSNLLKDRIDNHELHNRAAVIPSHYPVSYPADPTYMTFPQIDHNNNGHPLPSQDNRNAQHYANDTFMTRLYHPSPSIFTQANILQSPPPPRRSTPAPPASSASPAPSNNVTSTSAKKDRKNNHKITDVADPHICSLCLHQTVTRGSIRRHFVDKHKLSKENMPAVLTTSELIANGVDVSTKEGIVMPNSFKASNLNEDEDSEPPLKKPKHSSKTTTEANGNSNVDHVPEPSVTHSFVSSGITMEPSTPVQLHHMIPQQSYPIQEPQDWSNMQEVDAYLQALRSQGGPYSNKVLANIARAALERLPPDLRRICANKVGSRFSMPVAEVRAGINAAFDMLNAQDRAEEEIIGTRRSLLGYPSNEPVKTVAAHNNYPDDHARAVTYEISQPKTLYNQGNVDHIGTDYAEVAHAVSRERTAENPYAWNHDQVFKS